MGNSCVVGFVIQEDGAFIDRGNNERASISLSGKSALGDGLEFGADASGKEP